MQAWWGWVCVGIAIVVACAIVVSRVMRKKKK